MMKYDYLIIGCGIIGLSIAFKLKGYQPAAKILLIDKEKDVAQHASGRNSGVLHAGFYYTADSLKAKFTVEGNRALKEYCQCKNIPINHCGKLVVAKNEEELQQLYELEKRGKKNGSHIRLISQQEARAIEPNVKTYQKALHSPDTASVNPTQVCRALKDDLLKRGVAFRFETNYFTHHNNIIETNQGTFQADQILNCGGLYADKIAHDFGLGEKYTILPFKGLYLKYTKNNAAIRTNIYPVPDLRNPFLGVHFTKTVTGEIKIGPTATPVFWRENYRGFSHFNLGELLAISSFEARLFISNSFGFRNLALEEIKKYNKDHFINLARDMVLDIDPKGFTDFTVPGIRAQLLEKKTLKLVQDFIIEGDSHSTHILNAVSPAFTCAFPFADHIIQNFILNKN